MAGQKIHAERVPLPKGGPQLPAYSAMDASTRDLHKLQLRLSELERQNQLLHKAQVELEASRDHYLQLYDEAPMGYCTVDSRGKIVEANSAAASLLGEERGALLGKLVGHYIFTEEKADFRRHCAGVLASSELQTCDLRMVRKDGSVFWGRLRSIGVRDADGQVLCRMAFGDISDSKRNEQALREQEEFFHLIAENLCDFIAVLDLQGRRLYNSPSYQQFFGMTKDLRTTDSFDEIHPDDKERVMRVFQETVRSGEGQQIEYRFLTADGRVRHMESRGSVIRDSDGQVARVVVVSHDITERRQLQDEVRQLAFHDGLTQLPNRRLLGDRLSQAMAASTRSGAYGALIFLDLDNFKQLNDTHGHDVGDRLLIEVADRLRHCVREIDTVARFGGDEFVVVLSELATDREESVAQARSIAEKLRIVLADKYLLPTTHPDNGELIIEHSCSASIGVALFKNHQVGREDIFKQADCAMYQAKKSGRNRICFFDGKA